ncbi:uncharacterized protein MONOS_7204 [Monocercomonoides exilis]|uniref:uncharacterized protein n=1 Tax=Monocercomonoides exilis TaxID=2049356 RepID=UPI00355A20A1|nr:hypothetical protein MONOS_7204 [Monocercomonoides exilis]|eukprot:MONOS_7204.1-p1 / transcript=MONOS_7204.1 / gene=MONOS_7204 / organism=Monocercomonoides_exilis_PA203 / gene_product=unspecified product / transcript_product=unspecified product / location=Mono_scaffold00241:5589-6528(+) / protein_length=290 / sequence_SO=supercontig / SO=protein_coding / is_pseudo=false
MPCLLKVALNKDKNEEAQKEVEMALFSLSNINGVTEMKKELYLKEITEIIKHHQERLNLTQLAYQSTWEFLIFRYENDKSLAETIVNELHFSREATRELEKLTECVNRKMKENKLEKNEMQEIQILMRWLRLLNNFFISCKLWKEEHAEVERRVVSLFRTTKVKEKRISDLCISLIATIAKSEAVGVDDLLKGGIVDVAFEEIHCLTLEIDTFTYCLELLKEICDRIKILIAQRYDVGMLRTMRTEIFEVFEEDGYEDLIVSFQEMLPFFVDECFQYGLSKNYEDYFIRF